MSILSVDRFIANIDKGLASPNKYQCWFTSPINGYNESVEMMCNVAQLPGRSIKLYENRHYGVPFKLPFTAEYADITFTFINRTQFPERKHFEEWQEKVLDPKTGLLNFYDKYKGNIKIFHLDNAGNNDYAVELHDAYPVIIAEVPLGYSMVNEASTVSITFTYRYWKTI